jgi:hypothetical protein
VLFDFPVAEGIEMGLLSFDVKFVFLQAKDKDVCTNRKY